MWPSVSLGYVLFLSLRSSRASSTQYGLVCEEDAKNAFEYIYINFVDLLGKDFNVGIQLDANAKRLGNESWFSGTRPWLLRASDGVVDLDGIDRAAAMNVPEERVLTIFHKK